MEAIPMGFETCSLFHGTGDSRLFEVTEAQSAQQRVWIVKLTSPSSTTNEQWKFAFENGRNRVVVRLWQNACRWWNLNQNGSVQSAAQAEVLGYRLARRIFEKDGSIRIPRVLHFELDGEKPWAVMEYVGYESTLFDGREPDELWVTTMIQQREEYGFLEPHPRWGRIPVDSCLVYARNILHTVVLPIHQCINNPQNDFFKEAMKMSGKVEAFSYQSMCDLYESKLSWMRDEMKPSCFGDAFYPALDSLSLAISQLHKEAKRISALDGKLSAVICHMDYQPQNILFYKRDNLSCTASVLDWEEAAWADPRFELLLLGRKVCANKQQAHQLWEEYEANMNVKLGPLVPWLMLESVHSITSIMLQALGAGGRSPWEAKADLLGKVQREFQRLSLEGWTCWSF